MKIITVNLPVQYLTLMKGLIGDKALYPSRSELIRVAVREFLIDELNQMKTTLQGQMAPKLNDSIKMKDIIQIQIGKNPDGTPKFVNYKIIQK